MAGATKHGRLSPRGNRNATVHRMGSMRRQVPLAASGVGRVPYKRSKRSARGHALSGSGGPTQQQMPAGTSLYAVVWGWGLRRSFPLSGTCGSGQGTNMSAPRAAWSGEPL